MDEFEIPLASIFPDPPPINVEDITGISDKRDLNYPQTIVDLSVAYTPVVEDPSYLKNIEEMLFLNSQSPQSIDLDIITTPTEDDTNIHFGVQPHTPEIIEDGIQVLVLSDDKSFLNYTTTTLELWHYQVTKVAEASIAARMISVGKKHFDLVIADADSPDIDGFQFCQEVDKLGLGILVILTSTKEDAHLAQKALGNGAFLYVPKPMDLQTIKYLWQFVMKARLRKNKSEAGGDPAAGIIKLEADSGVTRRTKETRKRKNKKNAADQADVPLEDAEAPDAEPPAQAEGADNFNRKKMCTEWTMELHDKFVDAVRQLGEGKCYPKEILEKMNVPGLTRMQVASHLQKCRQDKWRNPEARKSRPRNRSCGGSNGGESSQDREKSRVFGTVPRPFIRQSDQTQNNGHHQPPETTSASNHGNNVVENIASSEPENGTDQVTASTNNGNMESSGPGASAAGTEDWSVGITDEEIYDMIADHDPTIPPQ